MDQETNQEWQRRQRIRHGRRLVGERSRQAVLAIVEAHQPCTMTSQQIGDALGMTKRQVDRHLKVLREAGLITCETKYVRTPVRSGTVRKPGDIPVHFTSKRVITVVDSVGNGNPVPKGEVGREADAPPGFEAPGDDPQDTANL